MVRRDQLGVCMGGKSVTVLSLRATKLLARIKAGEWYPAYPMHRIPKAMIELERAGLVSITGRVKVIEAAYVPSTGYTPFKSEEFK